MSDRVCIHTVSLDVDEGQFVSLVSILSAAEQERARSFHFRRDSIRFVAARAALRFLLADHLGTDPAGLVFTQNEHGKPSLGGIHAMAPVRFNLSHSESLAVYAFALEVEVGVDVERIRGIQGIEGIVDRFFSPPESAAFARVPSGKRTPDFFKCWTRKEAYIKGVGFGLSIPLQHFDALSAPGEPVQLLDAADIPVSVTAAKWYVAELVLPRGYVGAVALQGKPPQIEYLTPPSTTPRFPWL